MSVIAGHRKTGALRLSADRGGGAVSRAAKKAATRRALKNAAMRCFAARGYGETQIADISRTASVAHGTFYVHFDNKEALLDELLDEFNAEFARRFLGLWSQTRSQGLQSIVEAAAALFLGYWQDNAAFVTAYSQRAATGLGPEALRHGINPPMVRLLRQAFGDAPGLDAQLVNLELIVHALLAMWMRVGLLSLDAQGDERKRAERTLVRLTLGAVAPLQPAL